MARCPSSHQPSRIREETKQYLSFLSFECVDAQLVILTQCVNMLKILIVLQHDLFNIFLQI